MASIRKRGDTYQINVSNGVDSHGKQIREYTTFVPDPHKTDRQNEKALQKFAADFEERVKTGRLYKGDKMTYSDYIELWLKDYAREQMEPTSVERCEISLNNTILPALGHMKLSDIQPLTLQNFYSGLQEKGYTRDGKHYDYSPNTIRRIHQIISSSLSTAVQWQLIESNPCSRVKPPKVPKNDDVKHFTPEQAERFLEYLDEPYTVTRGGRRKKDGTVPKGYIETRTVPLQYKILFLLAIHGGFRRGELVALTWDDIDFENHTITIQKSSARTREGVITKTPKTYSSYRTVSISEELISLLQDYKKEQEEYRLSLGTYWEGDNYIFIQDNGKQMDISTPNKEFQKIIKRYNETDEGKKDPLPLITLNGLRHTSATLLISEGVDPKTVQTRLGHSEISTTMDIYSHALRKQDESAEEKIDQALKREKNKKQ